MISNPPEPIEEIETIVTVDDKTFRKQMLTKIYKSVRKNIITE